MTLCIAHKRPCIDGVVYLLLVQGFARNVDGLEPFQFLRGLTLADIDGQLVVENLSLYILGLIEEVFELVGELAIDILAE